ncbi:aldo-keto reductase family 1 member A1-like [Coccinella septempunctata]|uniref:aldo-keto reductase family 1 member A1-like n=1 Tax=Coccinella septempunctata TaxID=41139 RepID=UPI001D08DAD3|nr:aldo-keto reductase family 1 member A1-like [Coccinella septempunctata]
MSKNSIILNNGAKMPLIGLGTWQVNDPFELKNAMNVAFESGYRHFDTAFLYHNEKLVGEVIQDWIKKGLVKREELFITTKLPVAGVHPDRVQMFLNKSLQNLGLEYVDLYLVHFPVCVKYNENQDFPVNSAGQIETEPTDHIAVWKKMEEMVKLGKTRSIGVSNFNKKQISRILENATIKPANLQIEAHLYFQNTELIEFCKNHGISVVAYSPLGSPAVNIGFKKRGLPTKDVPKIMEDENVISIAKKHSRSPAQVMLRFLVQNGIAAIPKSITPSRIRDNINIFDFQLDDKDLAVLRTLDKVESGRVCDMKGFNMSEHPEFPFR